MMRITTLHVFGLALVSLLMVGCADPSVSASTATTPSSAATSTKYLLTSEPVDALDVLDVKEKLEDGQKVVVVGRVGGGYKAWIDGRAAFLLIDTRVESACEDGDKCELGCPGCSKQMLEACTMVKFLGDDGKVMPVDARELLGLKDRQTVVIEGVASRDSTGNVSIAGQGIFIRK